MRSAPVGPEIAAELAEVVHPWVRALDAPHAGLDRRGNAFAGDDPSQALPGEQLAGLAGVVVVFDGVVSDYILVYRAIAKL